MYCSTLIPLLFDKMPNLLLTYLVSMRTSFDMEELFIFCRQFQQ